MLSSPAAAVAVRCGSPSFVRASGALCVSRTLPVTPPDPWPQRLVGRRLVVLDGSGLWLERGRAGAAGPDAQRAFGDAVLTGERLDRQLLLVRPGDPGPAQLR